jgi:hypothetical protein
LEAPDRSVTGHEWPEKHGATVERGQLAVVFTPVSAHRPAAGELNDDDLPIRHVGDGHDRPAGVSTVRIVVSSSQAEA